MISTHRREKMKKRIGSESADSHSHEYGHDAMVHGLAGAWYDDKADNGAQANDNCCQASPTISWKV